jgi:hypothetical protein
VQHEQLQEPGAPQPGDERIRRTGAASRRACRPPRVLQGRGLGDRLLGRGTGTALGQASDAISHRVCAGFRAGLATLKLPSVAKALTPFQVKCGAKGQEETVIALAPMAAH